MFSSKSTLFFTILSLLLLLANANPDLTHANLINPSLKKRTVTSGGWALINPVCPKGSTECGYQFSCCPAELECTRSGYGHHCCPTGTTCLEAYQSSPQCADDSWNMWKMAKTDEKKGYFCCLPGQIGTNAESCVSSNTPVVASLSASLVATGTGIAPSATVPSKTSGSSTATKAVTSASAATDAASTSESEAPTAGTTSKAAEVTKTGGAGRVGSSFGGGVAVLALSAVVIVLG